MKNINKILSLVLALVMVLSSTPVYAYTNIPESDIIDDIFRFDVGEFLNSGSGDEQAIDPDIEKIKFLDAVGMWDDAEKSKNSLITMTEFSIIMSKVKLGSENAVLKVYEKNPDETNVTYKTAIEYLLHLTGYYYRCKEFGNTDASLLAVASQIDLIDEPIENINAFITRGALAKLISKAITIDMCVIEYLDTGDYKYSVAPNKNILNTYHDIRNVSGFVTGIPGLTVYGGSKVRDGYIQIDRTDINTSDMDLNGYFGTLVEAYAKYNSATDEYSIVYITYSEEYKPVEIDFKDIADINSYELVYTDADGIENEFRIDNLKTVVENGKKLASISDMSDFRTSEGKVIFTSSSKNGSYDTAIIYKYNYYVVDYYDTIQHELGLKFYAEHNGGNVIQMDDNAVNNITINGDAAAYSDIAPNSSIRVLECINTGYKEIVASTEKVQGKVTLLYDDIIEVGGKEYRISKDVINNVKKTAENDEIEVADKIKLPELGDQVTLYIVGNIVAGFTVGSDYTLAYLKSAQKSRTSIDAELTLRVFTENADWMDLTFANKLELDGAPGTTKEQAFSFIEENFSSGRCIGGDLIRFKTNGDGKLTALDTVYESPSEFDTNDDITYVETFDTEVDWTKWQITDSKYLFKPTCTIFAVPENMADEKNYRAVKPSSLTEGMTYSMRYYNPDKFQQVSAMLYHGDLSISSTSESLTFFYIESIRDVVIDADNNKFGYRIIGKQFVNLRAKGKGIIQDASFYVEEDIYKAQLSKGNGFNKGDIIRIEPTANKLEKWEMLIAGGDYSSLSDGITELLTYNHNKYSSYIGTIEAIDVTEMIILIDCGEDGKRTVSPRSKGIIDLDKNTITNVTLGDFHVGERVYVYAPGAHAEFIIKTVGGNVD